ncbi:MAG: ATP-binding protein [Gemmatimonadales bacterium]|nr:ATP-binding protein [Gemmatimonadales bacterium]
MTDPFASFVADPANQAALSAARMVAETPRMHYLLLLVGTRGSGKSHLLRAIRDRLAGAEPPRSAELVSLVRLAEHVQAKGLGDAGLALRERLLRAEVVLFDDLDVTERQLPVQSFVFDVIESRLAAGLATVIATGKPLGRLAGLDARLARRLRDASAVDLGLPAAPARAAILGRRIAEAGCAVAPGLAATLAGLELASVKEYLGALNRILVVQQTTPKPISVDDALALLGLEPEPNRSEPAAPAPAPEDGAGEFDAFLTEVVANVSQQFDHWRGRLREAIAYWQGQGVKTRRLEQALLADSTGDPEPVVAAFGHDAGELLRLGAEARVIAPDLAGAEIFRDPDQLVAARHLVQEARARRAPLSAPLPDLTLARLGVGASNRVALEALAAVVAEPGVRHNPLVLVGPSGVGKTHLLHGLGNALMAGGLSPVACLSAHSFLGELAAQRSPEETAQWRARYQWVAGFLLDDVHLLSGETRAQAELLQIYAALEEGGRPMAFASARPLSELAGFDHRLLTRFQGGTVVDVAAPDREVRLAVIRTLLAESSAAEDVGLIDYLAGRPADSVRSVQGMVHRVLAEAQAERIVPSVALARETLEAVEAKPIRREKKPVAPTSGILSPGMGIVRSREKMILEWPSPADRLLPEFG